MQPTNDRVKVQVLVVPINSNQPINESQSPPNEPISWEGKHVTVKTYSEGWGAVMKLFKKATLVKIKEEGGQEREVYVNKRSLGKQMLMAQGTEEKNIKDKDKDAAYELLFSKKPISKLSQNQILCIPSTLFEQVHTMLDARRELKNHTGKQDEESYKETYDRIHDTYVSQNQNIATTYLKSSLRTINELIESAETKFKDLKKNYKDFKFVPDFNGFLTNSLDTLEWEELSPSVEMELEQFTSWLSDLHSQLDSLAKIPQHVKNDTYDFDRSAKKFTESAQKRPITPWLDTIEFLHSSPENTQVYDPEIVRCLTEAARQGNVKAQFKLGQLYEKGINGVIECNIQKSIQYYQQAAGQGHTASQARLGQMYLNGDYNAKSDQDLGTYLEAAAEKNNRAAAELGVMLGKGTYTPKSESDRIKYLGAAVLYNIDIIGTRKYLGQLILEGGDTPSNEIASRCLESLAHDGNLEAQYRRGLIWSGHSGRPFLILAANQGHMAAQHELGKLLLNDSQWYRPKWGVKDPATEKETLKNQAIHYLSLAAEGNHAESQYLLGMVLCNSKDDSISKSGVSYLEKAAESGHADAVAELGSLYVREDRQLALRYLVQYFDLQPQMNPHASSYNFLFFKHAASDSLYALSLLLPDTIPSAEVIKSQLLEASKKSKKMRTEQKRQDQDPEKIKTLAKEVSTILTSVLQKLSA